MAPDLSSHHYQCITPPPLSPKHHTASPQHPHYASLISSPLTPQSSNRTNYRNVMNQHERFVLSAMLSRSQVHRNTDEHIYTNTIHVGNAAFIKNRSVIVEWMSEVCTSFDFRNATLHLAVRHMDWVFSMHALPKHYWQLCAVAAIFLAAKCEEAGTKLPAIEDLKYICDNLFDVPLIRRMEMYILQLLKWDVVAKTPTHFLDHFISVIRARPALYDPADDQYCAIIPDTPKFATKEFHEHSDDTFDIMSGSESGELDLISEGSRSPSSANGFCEHERMSDCTDAGSDGEFVDDRPMNNDADTDELPVRPCLRQSDRLAAKVTGGRLHRVAICILDLSLYDPTMRGQFASQTIATAALSIAMKTSRASHMRDDDLCALTNVSELTMLECRAKLWRMFQEAQR